MVIKYFRLFLAGLMMLSLIAHSQDTIELEFKFADGEQAESFIVDKDIIQSLKTLDNIIKNFGGYNTRVKDTIPLGIGASLFHKIIRVLSEAKSILRVDEMHKREIILETYNISHANPRELQDVVEKVVQWMRMSSDELLHIIEVADYLDVAAIFQAGAKLWAKQYSVTASCFNSLSNYLQEAIIRNLNPHEFLALMRVNESNPSGDPEESFRLALRVYYKEDPPSDITAKEHYERQISYGDFVLIPGQDYEIGSPATEANRSSDETLHRISLNPFFIMSAAVTQEFYAQKMGTNPSIFKEAKYCPESSKTIEVNGKKILVCSDHPVEMVSHNDAIAFAKLLSDEDATYTYSIPSEAQLEVAFRGGTTTAYVSGDDEVGLQDYLWYSANSKNQTHPVRSKRANALGIYRSSIWEWVADWNDKDYLGSTGLDPKGPASGLYRVIRGGSWFSNARSCRSAYRNLARPEYRCERIGFRLVRTRK